MQSYNSSDLRQAFLELDFLVLIVGYCKRLPVLVVSVVVQSFNEQMLRMRDTVSSSIFCSRPTPDLSVCRVPLQRAHRARDSVSASAPTGESLISAEVVNIIHLLYLPQACDGLARPC